MNTNHLRIFSLLVVSQFLMLGGNAFGQELQWSDQIFRQTLPQFERSVSPESRIPIPNGVSSWGDGITGIVGADGSLTISGSGQAVVGLELISPGGFLQPIPDGAGGAPDPNPFQILLSNTNEQVTLGVLGDGLILDGSIQLGAGYVGEDPLNELFAQWGRGVDVIEFPVRRQDQQFGTPFNLLPDGRPVNYSEGVYLATIESGTATGTPPDSPADRVDPNDASAMFPGVGSLEVVHPTLGTFVCTGTVIDDTHVLTAGHCFDYDSDGLPDTDIAVDSKFYLNDGGSPSATIDIATVDIHPDFSGFITGGSNDDLAIVTLASAVPSGTTKYAIRTGISDGDVLELVGYGVSGEGDVGGFEILPDLHVKRSGKNVAELFVVDDEGAPVDEVFMYDFDGPEGDGFLGGPSLGNDIESVVRGGDSGGPAFVDFGATKALAGVNTFEFVLEPTTPGTGEFGVLGGGVIIGEAQFGWITSIATGAAAVPEPSASTMILAAIGCIVLFRRKRM